MSGCGEIEDDENLSARGGTDDGSEEWGYIPVRPSASMFYWFYRTTHPDDYLNRPIAMWLQGGPSLSGTGIGNFLEFGPLDQNLEARNSTWIQTANILIVDNPVGVGFSIAKNRTFIPDTSEHISYDLITFLQTFLNEHSELKTNPLYIMGQSYGGKMAAALIYYLHIAIQAGEIQCNLKGVCLGNAMVSHPDNVVTWAPLIYEISLIDDVQYENLSSSAWNTYHEAEKGNWAKVQEAWGLWWFTVRSYVPTFNWYSVTDLFKIGENRKGSVYDITIDELMNGHVRNKLGIIPDDKQWSASEMNVFWAQYQSLDGLQPVWHLVDEVLKSSDIDIVVYSGQLDIICNTAGALRWIHKLTWPGKGEFDKAERKLLTNPDTDVSRNVYEVL